LWADRPISLTRLECRPPVKTIHVSEFLASFADVPSFLAE
jgi:hypothetical protein